MFAIVTTTSPKKFFLFLEKTIFTLAWNLIHTVHRPVDTSNIWGVTNRKSGSFLMLGNRWIKVEVKERCPLEFIGLAIWLISTLEIPRSKYISWTYCVVSHTNDVYMSYIHRTELKNLDPHEIVLGNYNDPSNTLTVYKMYKIRPDFQLAIDAPNSFHLKAS